MAESMFVLRPTKKTIKTVCHACVERGEVIERCPVCRGRATKGHSITQYYVKDTPIFIDRVDREPETGILRYWENSSEFFYETVYPELNKYVPEVPHGIHLCHYDVQSAIRECARINTFLNEEARAKIKNS